MALLNATHRLSTLLLRKWPHTELKMLKRSTFKNQSWIWNILRRICLFQHNQNFASPSCMVVWSKPIVCLELLYRDISFPICLWLYDHKLWNKHVQLLCMNIFIAIIIETMAIILLYGSFKAFQNILLMLQQRITLKKLATSASYNSLVHDLTVAYVLRLVSECGVCSRHCKGSSMMHISKLRGTDFGVSVSPLFLLVFELPLFKCDDNQSAYI